MRRRFPLDQPVALPYDTIVLMPEFVNSSGTPATNPLPILANGSACSPPQGSLPVAGAKSRRFLAVSPSKASYVAFDEELLEPFEALLAGKTLEQIIGCRSKNNIRPKIETLLTNLVLRNFFNDAEPHEEIYSERLLQLYVTNRCDLRCKHCYMSSGLPLPGGEIGTFERLRALDLFAESCPGGRVTFTGGEALLSADIYELLNHAKSKGLIVELYTNGLSISASTVDRILGSVDILQISLDGATAPHNDFIRGRGTFRKILRAIRVVDRASGRFPNFRYKIAITITPSNSSDLRGNLPRLIRRLNLKGRHQFRIGASSQLGRAARNPHMFSDLAALRRNEADIIHTLAVRGIYHLPTMVNNVYSKTCGMGLTITVGADGAIYPCTITGQPPIGNICDADAADVFRRVASYTEATGVDNVEGCRECAIRYFCKGICRLTNLFQRGQMSRSACTPEYKDIQVRSLIDRYHSFEISQLNSTVRGW